MAPFNGDIMEEGRMATYRDLLTDSVEGVRLNDLEDSDTVTVIHRHAEGLAKLHDEVRKGFTAGCA